MSFINTSTPFIRDEYQHALHRCCFSYLPPPIIMSFINTSTPFFRDEYQHALHLSYVLGQVSATVANIATFFSLGALDVAVHRIILLWQ
jgi:hypothetical protein